MFISNLFHYITTLLIFYNLFFSSHSISGVPVEEHNPLSKVLLLSQSQTINARTGDNVTLKCDVSAQGRNLVHIWSRVNKNPNLPEIVLALNSDPFGNSDERVLFNTYSSDDNTLHYEMTLLNVSNETVGVYVCKFSAMKENVTYSLSVLEPPKIEVEKSVVQANKGEHVRLSCSAPNSPDAIITWTRNGSFPKVPASGNTISFVASQEFTGPFTCTATNQVGSSSGQVYLEVLCKFTLISKIVF